MRLPTLPLALLWFAASAATNAAGPAATAADPATQGAASPTSGPVVVYKSPSCGCCAGWVEYLRRDGFEVEVRDQDDLSGVKRHYGVTPRLASCHTAIVDGYVIEGHVPVGDIRRLLRERPAVLGLTAPGMPQLSPGMHSLIPRDYDVLSFDRDGRVTLYSRY